MVLAYGQRPSTKQYQDWQALNYKTAGRIMQGISFEIIIIKENGANKF